MTTKPATPGDKDPPREPVTGPAQAGEAPDGEAGIDADDASVADWVEAEASRPTLPDETADGLDDMDEEVRRQAEDLPPDTPGRLR